MTDTFLTILGCSVYIPWLVLLARTHWRADDWSRQWLLMMLSLQLISVLHIPSVMYSCAGISALSLLVYMIHGRTAFHWTPVLGISLAYVAWFAISLSWSAVPYKGMLFLIDNGLPMLGFATAACVLQVTKEELSLILRPFCQAACIFIFMGLVSWCVTCTGLNLSPWEWPVLRKEMVAGIEPYKWIFRFMGGVGTGYWHPSYNLLTVFIAACCAAWLPQKRIAGPVIWWFLWTGSTILTFLTQSRMGIIYSGMLLVGYILYRISNKRVLAGISVSLVLAGAIAWGFTQDFWKQYADDPTRDTLYADTWRYIQKKPWTGAGAGALNPVEICHTIGETFWPNVGYIDPARDVADWQGKAHMLPHNQWMADWAHGGLPAALLSLVLYICFALLCYRKRCYWGAVAWTIFVVFSFLEPTLYIGKGLYLFCLLLLFLQAYRDGEEQTSRGAEAERSPFA